MPRSGAPRPSVVAFLRLSKARFVTDPNTRLLPHTALRAWASRCLLAAGLPAADADTDSNAGTYSHADSDSDPHTDSKTYAHAEAFAQGDAQAESEAVAKEKS